MTVPEWLTGPVPGPRLGTTAVAALAQIALDTAASHDLRPGELTVMAHMHLAALGPANGWPDPAGPAGAIPPLSIFTTDSAAEKARRRPVRLVATARAVGGGTDEPGTPVRRAEATVATADGRPLASASAICPVIRPASASRPEGDRPGAGHAHDAVRPQAAARHAAESPDGLVTHVPAPHPLLDTLAAGTSFDGDRMSLRLTPQAWLGNRLGRTHGAACCALADAAVSTALTRRLPIGSAVHALSLDVNVLRSVPLETDVVGVATVRNIGRRLAVVDVELGQEGAPPSVLARAMLSRSTHHRPHR